MAEKNDGIIETIKTIFWALLIAGLFRSILFQPFFIPTGSMKDTLLIGDFVFVNKMAYGWSKYSCPFSACPIPERIWGEAPDLAKTMAKIDAVSVADIRAAAAALTARRTTLAWYGPVKRAPDLAAFEARLAA